MALSNSGLIDANGGAGLTLANFSGNNLRGGILQVEAGDSMQVLNGGSPIYNFGTINLKGDNSQLSGDPLHNGYQAAGLSGTMQGQGYILNSVTNDGTISPQGGQLVISGAGCENDSAGAIKLAAGTGILFTQGISQNYGLISLAGGTFDNNNNPLTNWGSILGNGTFSSGTLSNYNVVTFSGGNSSIYGVVNNVYGGTINTTEATYFGNVVNYGYVKATGGTVSMLAGLTNYGTYISDPAANYFTGLSVGPSGVLQGGVGDSSSSPARLPTPARSIWAATAPWSSKTAERSRRLPARSNWAPAPRSRPAPSRSRAARSWPTARRPRSPQASFTPVPRPALIRAFLPVRAIR